MFNSYATKSAPAVVGCLYGFSDLPWADMAAAATFFYVMLQAGLLIRDRIKKAKKNPD